MKVLFIDPFEQVVREIDTAATMTDVRLRLRCADTVIDVVRGTGVLHTAKRASDLLATFELDDRRYVGYGMLIPFDPEDGTPRVPLDEVRKRIRFE